jgi:hypothetical protein
VGLAVAVKIVRHEIVVSMVDDSIDKGREGTSVTEHAAFDGLEDLVELVIELVVAIYVGVA